uniref:Reverse transcriptase domain-containing protein n=1 Tax=Xenopus tropicalis TaxID=8364 RepID=A0A803K6G7_XENTR
MVKLLTLNVNGLNSVFKRYLAIREIHRLKPDIALLQETHFRRSDDSTLKSNLYPKVFQASAEAKKAGVLIMIHKDCPYQVSKVTADQGGRYLILDGSLRDKPLTIMNIYAPNKGQQKFLRSKLTKGRGNCQTPIIIGGDFNLVFSDLKDRSLPPVNKEIPEQSKKFRQMVRKLDLRDIWRIHHPNERTYTFFSARHNLYTRLDYFLISRDLLHFTATSSILPITWTDHDAVTFEIEITHQSKRKPHWRLNEALLNDLTANKKTLETITEYFAINKHSIDSMATLWEAHKAVLRGHFISTTSYKRKMRIKQITRLEHDLTYWEKLYHRSPSQQLKQQITQARRDLKKLLLADTEKALRWLKQKYYESGDKPHTLLAKKLREQLAQSAMLSIDAGNGQLVYAPEEIAEVFRHYYTALYNLHTQQRPDEQQRLTFLKDNIKVKLTQPELNTLNTPITEEEIATTIKSFPTMKAPGPDGFPYAYYTAFSATLTPYLSTLFNSFLEGSPIPPTMLASYITLLHKEGKDPNQCASYRPIALLNSDLKLFTKILANRLAPIMPRLINLDQVGFIHGRQAGDNTRRAIDIIDTLNKAQTPAVILSLDAEKAFDRLDWRFLFDLLQLMGFKGQFLTAIKALYSNPTATLKMPDASNLPIPILNGTRQGCPLSPLLYALSIEPLATAIREHKDITGPRVGNHEFLISLFADDVLLTVTNPMISLPNLHNLLAQYGKHSGYKLNIQKTEALAINMPSHTRELLKSNYKYKWKDISLKYLGVHLTKSYSQLYKCNYTPLLQTIHNLMNKWSPYTISWLGKIAALKMMILPKLLYLFETLPVRVPNTILRNIQTMFFKFIWGKSRHRVPKSVMMTGRSQGGLAVPNIIRYYEAAHLRQVLGWTTFTPTSKWALIESLTLTPTHPNSFLWQTQKPIKPPPDTLQAIRFTLQIWNRCCKKTHLRGPLGILRPVLANPQFPPGLSQTFQKHWGSKNLFRAYDFINPLTNKLYSFIELQGKHQIPQSWLFEYMQIIHFIQGPDTRLTPPTPLTLFERLSVRGLPQKALISNIYSILNTIMGDPFPKHKYMTNWEAELSTTLTLDQWEDIWENARKNVTCVRQKESVYKMILNWYHTPVKLNKIFPDTSKMCWRACGQEGTLLHIMWHCPKLAEFWKNIKNTAAKIFFWEIPIEATNALLGLPHPHIPHSEQKLLNYIYTAARLTITSKWKSLEPPSTREVISRLKTMKNLEEMTAKLRGTTPQHDKTWSKWDYFISQNQITQRYRPMQ